MYEAWISRCSKAHETDTNAKRKMAMLHLQPQVEQLYTEQPNVPTADQYIFKQPIEDILKLPTPALSNWVFKTQI
jgi:hypothetical protein